MEVNKHAPVVAASETEVAAAPEIVWDLIADVDGWPRWNPAVREASLSGGLREGSTAPHQSIAPEADFRFINVGQWASVAQFRAAMGQLGAHGVHIPYRPHPSLYEVVRDDEPAATSESAVVLINPFEVPAGADEEFITSWDAARDYLRGQSGYLHTRLHSSIV